MENKINIAEILKDCPKGMELDCTMYDNCTYAGIEDVGYIDILINTPSGRIRLTKEGCYIRHDDNAKCVIFPKGKTTWDGFVPPCKFEDGDVIYTKTYNSKWISVFEKFDDDECKCYVNYCIDSDTYYGKIGDKKNSLCEINDIVEQRFATEEEKEKLFQAIKDNGYRWNTETKTLEKLPKFKVGDKIRNVIVNLGIHTVLNVDTSGYAVKKDDQYGNFRVNFDGEKNWELVPDVKPFDKVGDRIKSVMSSSNKFDIKTLKPFDKVLVRCSSLEKWHIDFFEVFNGKNKYSFTCLHNNRYNECIPYEGNEHLLGTTNDCDKFYKNWE